MGREEARQADVEDWLETVTVHEGWVEEIMIVLGQVAVNNSPPAPASPEMMNDNEVEKLEDANGQDLNFYKIEIASEEICKADLATHNEANGDYVVKDFE